MRELNLKPDDRIRIDVRPVGATLREVLDKLWGKYPDFPKLDRRDLWGEYGERHPR